MKPLEGLLVLEFCQYLAGPSAGLRLADLGARVIKIERPGEGEGGRSLSIKNLFAGDESVLFHTINRDKESYTADLRDAEDFEKVKKLVARADVLTHNFRPGKIEKLGLGYESVKQINPGIIYGVVTGYGSRGPWATKPGQDLLVQAMSGLTYLSGDRDDPPVPFGMSVADILSGAHLVQGILAGLIKRGKTNEGSLVEVSLMESALDLQFEVLTTYLNDGHKKPKRARKGNAHAYLRAPYGIYETSDGYIAIAMEHLHELGQKIGCEPVLNYDEEEWFSKRDEIMEHLRRSFKEESTSHWLSLLEPADIWCADVYNYSEFLNSEAYKTLQMDQGLQLGNGDTIRSTRCPIRIDGERIYGSRAAPSVGEHNESIAREFSL